MNTQYQLTTALMAAALFAGSQPASAGAWQPLANQPPIPEIIDPFGNDYGPGGAAAPLLMTDGSVIIQNAGYFGEDAKVFKLTPDVNGSYVNGTWSQLASKPYIGSVSAQAVPVTNVWASVTPPSFFVDLYPPRASFAPNPIGDSASVILADGTFIVNLRTRHVFYSRTHHHSSMAVASDQVVSTRFDVPAGQESGLSLLEVVANGIASFPVAVYVH